MKSQLKAKLLQHFAGKKANGGFTLIELLVVIIIIGILSAIALPSFLNQANKAKQSEAKTYVGSMNRAQQAYYLENNGFADFDNLGLGIPATTANYGYTISAVSSTFGIGVTNQGAPVVTTANPNPSVKAYVGGVQIISDANGDANSVAILCEALKSKAADPTNAATGTETAVYATSATADLECDANPASPTVYKPV